MAWVRIDDKAMTHPKIVGLSDKAFRLWVWGLAYCQQHLTDGLIPAALPALAGVTDRTALVLVLAGLWEALDAGGWRAHDYLDWNDSREYVESVRQLAKARMVLVRDPEMRERLRMRDQDLCRYCARSVNWADRKSEGGATYDYVTPGGGDTFENLVIACRGCNSRKQRRTPEQANMALLPPPVSKSVSRNTSLDQPLVGNGLSRFKSSFSERESEGKPTVPVTSMADPDLADRAARLVERYGALFLQHRGGAKYRPRPNLDWHDALTLVPLWDDARLEKLAVLVLTTDDPWIAQTDRGFKIFAMKASWADDRLRAWELEHGVAV